MFHTLFDYQDQNADFNRRNTKGNINDAKNRFKTGGPNYMYFGKGNKAIDQYNRKKTEYDRIQENNKKFEKTKNKVKLVVFKNGFILNNGPFRELSIPENSDFMADVEKGNIPQELIRKGIVDLGILLVNRKSEMFRSPLYHSMPLSFESINVFQKNKQNQKQNNDPNQKLPNNWGNQNNGTAKPKSRYDAAYVPQTPMGTRNERNNFFFNSSIKTQNRFREFIKKTSSLPKDKKIINLNDLTKGKNDNKKFKAFSGAGKLLGAAIIDGLLVENIDTTYTDYSSPTVCINIKLFNGEVVGREFNYNQTVRDVYSYTREFTGSNNFVLFTEYDEPLIDYGRSISELGIENVILTQKMN